VAATAVQWGEELALEKEEKVTLEVTEELWAGRGLAVVVRTWLQSAPRLIASALQDAHCCPVSWAQLLLLPVRRGRGARSQQGADQKL